MSRTPAASRVNPCSLTSTPRSRARLPGWQEIYNTRWGSRLGNRCQHLPGAGARGVEHDVGVALAEPGLTSRGSRPESGEALRQVGYVELRIFQLISLRRCGGPARPTLHRPQRRPRAPPICAMGRVKLPIPQNRSSTSAEGVSSRNSTARETNASLTAPLIWMKSVGRNSSSHLELGQRVAERLAGGVELVDRIQPPGCR